MAVRLRLARLEPDRPLRRAARRAAARLSPQLLPVVARQPRLAAKARARARPRFGRSEEHTSELQSRLHLVCRLLLEKKKKMRSATAIIARVRTPTPADSLRRCSMP